MKVFQDHEIKRLSISFHARVSPEPNSGCWLWLGGIKEPQGYAIMYIGDQKQVYAHRISVALSGRHLPDGMQVDHLCRNRLCVNPDHLEVVTQKENIYRGTGPTSRMGAAAKNAISHCFNGHEYTPENMRYSGGKRNCRACVRENSARYRAKKVVK